MSNIRFKQNIKDFSYSDLLCETNKSGRKYMTPQGNKYPSITTILSILSRDAIKEWRDRIGHKEADKISRQSARRGGLVHNALESYIENIDPTIDDVFIEYLFKQIAFVLDDNLTEVNAIEKSLYSNYLGVAGRVDLVGVFNGKRSIIDFKTSLKPKPRKFAESYFMQEAFYAIAWEELTGEPINQLVTIIANEEVPNAQVFIEKRSEWQKPLMETIVLWKEERNA